MKLTFLYHPVTDLQEALAFYRDVLGWDEAWREGDTTIAMQLPGSELQVMLDVADPSAGDPALGPSGFYEVDDVDAFLAAHPGITPVEGPTDLPPIRCASFRDPAGNVFRLFHNLEPTPA